MVDRIDRYKTYILAHTRYYSVRTVPPLQTLNVLGQEIFEGNIWIQELLDAEPLRFAVDSGQLQFADADRPIQHASVPPRYRASVRAVRNKFDIGGFRTSVEAPQKYTFVCDATVHRTLPYDWRRLPPVVGIAIYDDDANRWLPPDVAARAYERLGLSSVNAFEREMPARHFYPDRYEHPTSAWYDGPPAGILIHDKNGGRACRYSPGFDPDVSPETDQRKPPALVEAYVTDDRIQQVITAAGASQGFDLLFERVIDRVFRETPAVVTDEDMRAFRSATAEQIQQYLD
jgi:hypothetical protein